MHSETSRLSFETLRPSTEPKVTESRTKHQKEQANKIQNQAIWLYS